MTKLQMDIEPYFTSLNSLARFVVKMSISILPTSPLGIYYTFLSLSIRIEL